MLLYVLCLLLLGQSSVSAQASNPSNPEFIMIEALSPTRFPTFAPTTGSIQTNPTRTPPRTTPPPTIGATATPSVYPSEAPSEAPTATPTDKTDTNPGAIHRIFDKLYAVVHNKPLVITGSAVSITFLLIVAYLMYTRRSVQSYTKLHRRTQSNTMFSPMHTTSSFSDNGEAPHAATTYHRVLPSFSSVVSGGDANTSNNVNHNLILDRMEEGSGLAMQYIGAVKSPRSDRNAGQYATLKHMKLVQDQERFQHRLKVEIPSGLLHENGMLRPDAAMGTLESRINNTPNSNDSVDGTTSDKRQERSSMTSPCELQLKLFDVIANGVTPQDIRENTVDGRILQSDPDFQRVTHHTRGVSMPNF